MFLETSPLSSRDRVRMLVVLIAAKISRRPREETMPRLDRACFKDASAGQRGSAGNSLSMAAAGGMTPFVIAPAVGRLSDGATSRLQG